MRIAGVPAAIISGMSPQRVSWSTAPRIRACVDMVSEP